MEQEKRFTHPEFRSAVRQLLAPPFNWTAKKMAEDLKRRGCNFEDAFVAIFGKQPIPEKIDMEEIWKKMRQPQPPAPATS